MPVFDFKSPGAEASRAIQELLAQRRLEARQEMLDRLDAEERKNVQTEREAASKRGDESLAIQRSAEKRYEDESKFNRGIATENMYSNRPAPPAGTDMSTLDPEYAAYRKKIGLTRSEAAKTEVNPGEWNPTQLPVDSTEGVVPGYDFMRTEIPSREVSIGSPEQQAIADKQARISSLLEQYNSASDETTKKAAAIQLIGEGLPAQAFDTDLTKFTEAQIIDPRTKKVTSLAGTSVPVGTEPNFIPFAPQMPAGYLPKDYQLYKDGKWIRSAMLDAAGYQAAAMQGYELRDGNTPVNDNNQKILSSTDILNLTRLYNDKLSARRAYENTWPGFRGDTEGQANDADVAYQRFLGGIAVNSGLGIKELEAATFINNDPELSKMDPELAAKELTEEGTDDADVPLNIDDLKKALMLFKGISVQ